jgi:NAD-dependent DNA ligase
MARETDLSDVARTLDVLEPVPTKYTQGKRICFTGHLGLPRDQYQRLVEQAGMVVEKNVSWGLHFLCTNKDWTSGSLKGAKKSRKLVKAEQQGTKIIDEKELLDLLSKTDDD